MTAAAALIPEFDEEMTHTRRMLERVPGDKGTWKPHPKSFALGHLAQLVAWMPGWIADSLTEAEKNLVAGGSGYSFEKTETLLAMFEENVRRSREALGTTSDADFAKPWTLKVGGHPVWTATRSVVVRNHINHLIHHRGQLSVYLRLNDVPLPATYGPSADERGF